MEQDNDWLKSISLLEEEDGRGLTTNLLSIFLGPGVCTPSDRLMYIEPT